MEEVWCVKPLRKNQRLIKQDGYFLLFGINGHKIFPAKIKNCIKVERWRIDSDSKKEIFDQLELMGISRDKLFPELDETAEYLKEKFKYGKTTKCY